MADDAMHFLVDEGAGLVARDAGTAITTALPAASITEPGSAISRTIPAAFAAKASIGHTIAPDADYQAAVTDTQIGFPSLTAPRTVTLPDVDAYPLGQVLFIADESGQCSATIPIRIAVGPNTGDSIAGQPAIQLSDAYQGIGLRRGAANLWIIAR